jgi:hypothetical protein
VIPSGDPKFQETRRGLERQFNFTFFFLLKRMLNGDWRKVPSVRLMVLPVRAMNLKWKR